MLPRSRRNARKARKRKTTPELKVAAIALTCAILGSIGGGTLAAYLMRGSSNTASAQATEATSQTQEATTSKEFQSAISTNSSDNYMSPSQIYSTYVDAVVGITNEGTTTNVYGQSSATASSGSGFIITADGYVVTNYHVIEKRKHVDRNAP
jgi:serine protease Do